jgi:hypothetical protein
VVSSLQVFQPKLCTQKKCVGHVARVREMRNANRILIIKPEGKRSLVRPRRRWEDNIKMDRREILFRVWIGFIWR